MDEETKLVTVFYTRKDAIMGVAKSILDDAAIEYEATNEIMPGGMKIMVRPEDEKEARDLLKDVKEMPDADTEEVDSKYTSGPSYYVPEGVVSDSNRYSSLGIIVFVIIVILLTAYFVRC